MRIFDCTTFFEEHLMMELRFNILNEYVEKFIVVESRFSHSGKEKKLNFDINKYKKFKDKIIYLVIDNEPEDIIKLENDNSDSVSKRLNSIKRLEQSYDYIKFGLKDASQEDIIFLSDNDEIPNLNACNLDNIENKIYIFKQKIFNYKFNLLYDLIPWYGTRACKFKTIKSFPWLKNLKNKTYPFWRLDIFFNKLKSMNVQIINNGGWHFNNLKTAEELYIKLINQGHHNEFDASEITVEELQNKINNRLAFYNHKADKKDNSKYKFEYKLKKIQDYELPKYLIENKEKYSKWFEKN